MTSSAITTPDGLEATISPHLFNGSLTVAVSGLTPAHIETLLDHVGAGFIKAKPGSAEKQTLAPLARLFDQLHSELREATS